MAAIFTTGITDTSTYYEMWEAVVAVTGMCVRAGYSGTAFLRGSYCPDDDRGSFVVGPGY